MLSPLPPRPEGASARAPPAPPRSRCTTRHTPEGASSRNIRRFALSFANTSGVGVVLRGSLRGGRGERGEGGTGEGTLGSFLAQSVVRGRLQLYPVYQKVPFCSQWAPGPPGFRNLINTKIKMGCVALHCKVCAGAGGGFHFYGGGEHQLTRDPSLYLRKTLVPRTKRFWGG